MVNIKLIDADRLYEIISEDQYELNNHKDPTARAIHNGEYAHFLRRIVEQPEVHLSIDFCYKDGEIIKNVKLNN